MAKKSKSFIAQSQRFFLSVFKIGEWFDWKRVKSSTIYIGQIFKRMFVPLREKKPESFKEATRQFQLSDKELLIKQKALFRLSILMIFIAFLILVYTIFQAFYGSIHATLISIVIMGIAVVLAFRYHFWYFQIKERKLGCSFQEWFRYLRGGK